jgi:hypothetical protein
VLGRKIGAATHQVCPTYALRVLWLEKEKFLQSYLTVNSNKSFPPVEQIV